MHHTVGIVLKEEPGYEQVWGQLESITVLQMVFKIDNLMSQSLKSLIEGNSVELSSLQAGQSGLEQRQE